MVHMANCVHGGLSKLILNLMTVVIGGPFFDPLGFSRGDAESYFEYQTKEVKNGRLAMLAFLGFFAQYAATGMCLCHCAIPL